MTPQERLNAKAVVRLPTDDPPDWFLRRVDKIETNLEKLTEQTAKLATAVHRLESKGGSE